MIYPPVEQVVQKLQAAVAAGKPLQYAALHYAEHASLAAESSRLAVAQTRAQGLPITYMRADGALVKEYADGRVEYLQRMIPSDDGDQTVARPRRKAAPKLARVAG